MKIPNGHRTEYGLRSGIESRCLIVILHPKSVVADCAIPKGICTGSEPLLPLLPLLPHPVRLLFTHYNSLANRCIRQMNQKLCVPQIYNNGTDLNQNPKYCFRIQHKDQSKHLLNKSIYYSIIEG